MKENKLPLHSASTEGLFKQAHGSFYGYGKGNRRVRIDTKNNKVWLRDGSRYYVQQFGNREQARRRYAELVSDIKNGRSF